MSNYTLGEFQFIRWEGIRPQFVVQHMIAYRKPGMDGIAALTQGRNGDEFRVKLTAIAVDDDERDLLEAGYRAVIGQVLDLVYEGVNYGTTHQTEYLVMGVSNTMAKRQVLTVGPDYQHYAAWHIESEWRLIPVLTE